jgi:hypothetical protein
MQKGRVAAELTMAVLILLPSNQTNLVLTSYLDTYVYNPTIKLILTSKVN